MRIARLLGVVLVVVGSASPVSALNHAPTVVDRASFSVSPEVGGPKTDFNGTLRNEGVSRILYGSDYWLQVRRNGRWGSPPGRGDCIFTSEGYYLQPTQSDSRELSFSCYKKPLEPGRYRVSKGIRFEDELSDGDRSDTVRAFFEVKS